jgi:hypothetical protein
MLVGDVGMLEGAGRSMVFLSVASVYVTGCGCYGNFLFLANWTAFPVLTSPCSALMMGQLGPKHVEVSGFYNIVVNVIQLCACV